jgi:pimeloyl-ACP methyl ester carboxylesterase
MVRTELERGYADAVRATHSIDKYIRPFNSLDGRTTLVRHIAALDARETAALGPRLRDIAVPAAVLCGGSDPFLPASIGRKLAESIPDATLEVISGARHFLPEDAPRQVADALTTLLAR